MIRNLTIPTDEYDEFLFAVHVVRAVEWQGRPVGTASACPACRSPKPEGHTSDCEIAQVIAADDRREESEAA